MEILLNEVLKIFIKFNNSENKDIKEDTALKEEKWKSY